MQLLIFVLVQPIKLRDFTPFTKLSPNKKCCLIASLQGKNYLQINVFLASGGRVEKNLKTLLIITTESLGSRAREKILSSIDKSFNGSHRGGKRDDRLDKAISDSRDVNISLSINRLLLWRNLLVVK